MSKVGEYYSLVHRGEGFCSPWHIPDEIDQDMDSAGSVQGMNKTYEQGG